MYVYLSLFILQCLDYRNCKEIIQIVWMNCQILRLKGKTLKSTVYTKEHWNVAKSKRHEKEDHNWIYCVYFFSLMKKSIKKQLPIQF